MGQASGDVVPSEFTDIARIDSKNMGLPVWQSLLGAVAGAQHRPDIHGIVVTHGTDTLEETAFLLHAFGPWPKPIVFTCAMRPADHPQADGPQNLRDALAWAASPEAKGVCVVFHHAAHHACHVQKTSTDPETAFDSGPFPLAGKKTQDTWQTFPELAPNGSVATPTLDFFLHAKHWPRVEWLTHHAHSGGALIDNLLSAPSDAGPVRGLVVAGTGAGTVNAAWEKALHKAVASGVKVWLTSRCAWGQAQPQSQQKVGELTSLAPAKACMALALALMAEDENRSAV